MYDLVIRYLGGGKAYENFIARSDKHAIDIAKSVLEHTGPKVVEWWLLTESGRHVREMKRKPSNGKMRFVRPGNE